MKLVNAKDAALIIGCHRSSIHKMLGKADQRLNTGLGPRCFYNEDRVLAQKAYRDKHPEVVAAKGAGKPRGHVGRYKEKNFSIDPYGNVIPEVKKFRGRICRHKGCKAEVETGRLYCDKHANIFRSLREGVGRLDEDYVYG